MNVKDLINLPLKDLCTTHHFGEYNVDEVVMKRCLVNINPEFIPAIRAQCARTPEKDYCACHLPESYYKEGICNYQPCVNSKFYNYDTKDCVNILCSSKVNYSGGGTVDHYDIKSLCQKDKPSFTKVSSKLIKPNTNIIVILTLTPFIIIFLMIISYFISKK